MGKGRILLVEPDEYYRKMFEIYFSGTDYEVIIKADANLALELIQSETFDILLYAVDTKYWGRKELITYCKQHKIPYLILIDEEEQFPIIIGQRIIVEDLEYCISKPLDIEWLAYMIKRYIVAKGME